MKPALSEIIRLFMALMLLMINSFLQILKYIVIQSKIRSCIALKKVKRVQEAAILAA